MAFEPAKHTKEQTAKTEPFALPNLLFDDLFEPKQLRILQEENARLRDVERCYLKLKTAVKCLLTQEQITMIELAIKD